MKSIFYGHFWRISFMPIRILNLKCLQSDLTLGSLGENCYCKLKIILFYLQSNCDCMNGMEKFEYKKDAICDCKMIYHYHVPVTR